MNLGEKAKLLLGMENICTRCIGRQFAKLGKMDNFERGILVKKYNGKLKEEDFSKIPDRAEFNDKNKKCDYCRNIFDKTDYYANIIAETLAEYDYSTFLIGSKLSPEILRKEVELWEKIGIEHTETIKAEFNRTIGKKVTEKVKKSPDFVRPDILIIVNDIFNAVELKINSLFIYGKYNKYKRGIPQTKWSCRECRGRGCKRCDFKGKMHDKSVEELIGEVLLEYTKGTATKFHSSGREDIDARCSAKREFVIEILEPVKRKINLKKIEKEINEKNKGIIEVFDLKFTDREMVEFLKMKKPDKTYRVLVEFENNIREEDLEKLKFLRNKSIEQETPQRVEHRRAKKIRKRKVRKIEWKKINEREAEIFIRTEAGLYIKELVTGDNGKTRPSISEILKNKAFCKELDVMEIHNK